MPADNPPTAAPTINDLIGNPAYHQIREMKEIAVAAALSGQKFEILDPPNRDDSDPDGHNRIS